MASNLVKPPISASHVVPPIPITRISKMRIRAHRSISATNPNYSKDTIFAESSCGLGPIRVAEPSSSSGFFVGSEEQLQAEPIQIKADLYEALQDTNRGIFGVPSAKKSEIEGLVKVLESKNPTPEPTLCMEKVGGCWKLVYSTITILGFKRTKLGLRDFITLGDIFQIIDVIEGKAVNVIMFNVTGLSLFRGQLKIEAFFKTATKSRVEIKYSDSKITPDQLMNVFQNNYNLLLGIFNPEGWLEITYVDDTMRIGRDDKGNIFILERDHEENQA